MFAFLLQTAAKLPLPLLHRLAAVLGSAAFYAAATERERIRANLQTANLDDSDNMVKRIFRETVKSGLELLPAFFRQPEHTATLFKQIHGWEHIEQALAQKQGLLLLTPHIGSYDLTGRFISERLPFPLTAMYKPPKIKALDKIMQTGRQRGKGRTAPTNMQGVKQIMQALRHGEATIILPDHVPNPSEGGDGVWADFFGRPAYTMTLAAKLAQMKNVSTLFFVGERLPRGQGFILHIAPLSGSLNGDKVHDANVINTNIENWVRRFPEQYLFAYNRYKHPAGAPPPPDFRQPEPE